MSAKNKKSRASKKKRAKTLFAIKKFFALIGTSLGLAVCCTLIIAGIFALSFMSTEKSEEYTLKIRTQRQTKATTIRDGDEDLLKQGYFPLTILDGVVGVKAVGDKKGITLSNPAGTEVMEVVPDTCVIIVNGTWIHTQKPILYKGGECYLPMEVIDKYTCLSVSLDDDNKIYTISTAGTEDISFAPKNSTSDSPM